MVLHPLQNGVDNLGSVYFVSKKSESGHGWPKDLTQKFGSLKGVLSTESAKIRQFFDVQISVKLGNY